MAYPGSSVFNIRVTLGPPDRAWCERWASTTQAWGLNIGFLAQGALSFGVYYSQGLLAFLQVKRSLGTSSGLPASDALSNMRPNC